MKAITLIFCLLFPALTLFSQQWHRARVSGQPDLLNKIGSLGIPVEGDIKKGVSITCDFSDEQIAKMQQAGLQVDIIIEDVKNHYINQLEMQKNHDKSWSDCYATPDYQIPAHFNHGSMGGYLTLTELYAELDEMRATYPSLISIRQIADTTQTIGGRQLYYVKISDNPDIDEAEPEVLFLSLTHAREPMGMQQLVFFMWYLLENYTVDEEIMQLIHHTEIYFLPCVNPDGYEYNRSTNPAGGGMWRKNRRNNGDGSWGVDLNRNYGFQWGYDNMGSSPFGTDETYRGSSAFSESETQVVKHFVENHEFLLIQDYHTYSNVLLYPWGYIDANTPDSILFQTYSGLMTSENGFLYGTANECIGYNANGGSFDWYYGEQFSKNKIIAWGPEVGDPNDGFWPAEALIDDICKNYIAENIYMVRFAGKYANVKDLSSVPIEMSDFIPFSIQRLGLDSPAVFTVSLHPLTSNVTVLSAPFVYDSLSLLEIKTDSFQIETATGIFPGEPISFELCINNGEYTICDTLEKIYGWPYFVFSDSALTMSNWTGTWQITTSQFVSSPSSFTDSPSGLYSNNSTSSMTISQPVDLSMAEYAWVEFYAKWDIEDGYDYAVFEISTNQGVSWTPLCGKYSTQGSADQLYNEPIYDGLQGAWVQEHIDLSDYLNSNPIFRFRLVTDSYETADGFYVDDFNVIKIHSVGIEEPSNTELQIFPNPADAMVFFNIKGLVQYQIVSLSGQKLMEGISETSCIDVSSLNNGTYLMKLVTPARVFTNTLQVVR